MSEKAILASKEPSLVERLRAISGQYDEYGWHGEIELEAADEIERLRAALEMLYDKWENGDPCYEDGDPQSNYLGNAFRLSEEEENEVLALIPRQCAASVPETGAKP